LVAALLTGIPWTRKFGVGMATGVALSWIVGVPTCVIVTMNTVPLG
jgi:predicted RND superfamily exporter protein